MTLPSDKAKLGSETESKTRGPIVHANCLSENSVQDLFPGMVWSFPYPLLCVEKAYMLSFILVFLRIEWNRYASLYHMP